MVRRGSSQYPQSVCSTPTHIRLSITPSDPALKRSWPWLYKTTPNAMHPMHHRSNSPLRRASTFYEGGSQYLQVPDAMGRKRRLSDFIIETLGKT
ncbi:unnamed protein product, partial [Mesorhabditis belari]|uniref:Uncharacterized protein n=1 Tax=Mesorhabditis belari TaxID=2138241 RepID=A0AAF3EM49_9BILA